MSLNRQCCDSIGGPPKSVSASTLCAAKGSICDLNSTQIEAGVVNADVVLASELITNNLVINNSVFSGLEEGQIQLFAPFTFGNGSTGQIYRIGPLVLFPLNILGDTVNIPDGEMVLQIPTGFLPGGNMLFNVEGATSGGTGSPVRLALDVSTGIVTTDGIFPGIASRYEVAQTLSWSV